MTVTSPEEEMYDAIGVEDYGYPQIDFIGDGRVRITLGWFFPDLDPDEEACYVEYFFDEKGRGRFDLHTFGCFFDFWTPLKEYGHYNDFGQWLYADGHVPFSFKHWRFRLKVKLHYWAKRHIPFVQRFSDWKYQRYCRKLFEVKETTT